MKKIKCQENDFSSSSLPSTRARQYFSIIKDEWRHLLTMALLMLIPAFILVLFVVIEGLIESGLTTTGDKLLAYFILDLCKIFVYVLAALVLAGVARVFKLWCFDSGVLFWSDFFFGLKQNGKVFALSGFLYGLASLLPSLLAYLFAYFGFSGNFATGLYAVSVGLSDLVVFPFLLFVASQSVIYELHLKDYFNNASRLYIKNALVSFLFGLAPMSLRLYELIPFLTSGGYAGIIGAYYFLSPLLVLAWYEYSLSCFDRFINKENFPALYRKGLSPYEE